MVTSFLMLSLFVLFPLLCIINNLFSGVNYLNYANYAEATEFIEINLFMFR